MKILVAQLNYTIGDLKGNTDKILEALGQARKEEVDIVVFSELALCGYPPEDLLLHESFIEEVEQCLEKIVKASHALFVVVGLPRKNPRKEERPLCNSAAIIRDGKLLGFQDKWLLPTYDVFDERRYFEPGKEVFTWELGGKKIAVLICEDIWQHAQLEGGAFYLQDPVEVLRKEKIDLLINVSASPYHLQKLDLRIRICKSVIKTLECPLILCCQVGGNDQLVFDGYSLFLGKEGEVIDRAKGFEEDLKIWNSNETKKQEMASLDPRKELFSALVLGVRDYFHKSGFKKACIGLSGGIDSALVACIAVEALGKENILGIGMPSRYSSSSSIEDAKLLAKNLGIAFEELSIEGPFQAYLELLMPYFASYPMDVTEENLQARVRGMILMAFSNKFGYIVLSTGNKSEFAFGYNTLYGDLCGGISVISDLTKKQVYELSYYVNESQEKIPISTLTKAPSAELRPNQKDSDSLPSYDVLDRLLNLYVEETRSPEEIAKEMQLDLSFIQLWIHKLHQAEYKRRQSPPGIRVSPKSFHVGRKYPIVQKWK